MRTLLLVAVVAGAALVAASPVLAHSAICNCYANPDKSITCEGGFSDGKTAAGVPIRVLDQRERVLIDGKMDEKSTFSFARPQGDFHVVFDAGGEHVVRIYSEDIE